MSNPSINDDQLIFEPIVFEDESSNYKFVYNFNLLTVQQAEIGREISIFKEDQRARGVSDVSEIFKSRGVDYLPMLLAYLTRKIKDDKIMPFVRDVAEVEGLVFFQNLPANKWHGKMLECATDFFSKAGLKSSESMILAGKKPPKSMQEILSETLMTKVLSEQMKIG